MPLKNRFLPIERMLRNEGRRIIAGIDEAGRGPLAGPVVCASVILAQNTRLPGLRDSKELSSKKREKLFKLIIEGSLDFAIAIASHKVVDRINISSATRYANFQCIKHMNLKPDIVLVDGIDKQIFRNPYILIVKGDQYVRSIAAASVLAKVARDRIMAGYGEIFPEYEFEKHMGYGTRAHKQNINKYGPCEIHRKSFTL